MDKKLFELNENTTPADSKRLAFGDASSGAENITLANFYTRLMSKLGFLKVANRLVEYYGNPTAQADVHEFINVYSKKQVDDKDALKANKSNVIEKDSTTPYTPTLGTHPVNLKVIQDKFYTDGLVFVFGDVAGTTARQVTIGKTMPNTNYMVFLEFQSTQLILPNAIVNKTTTTFDVVLAEEGNQANDVRFRWFLIAY